MKKSITTTMGSMVSGSKGLRIFALMVGMMLFGAIGVKAAFKTWVGAATGGSWSLASNWSPASVPNSTDDIVVNVGSNTFQFTGVSTVTIATLTINGTFGTFNWGTNSGTVTISGAVVCLVDMTLNAVSLAPQSTWTVPATKRIIINTTSNINLSGVSSLLTLNGGIQMSAGSVTNTSNSKLRVNPGGFYTYNSGANSGQLPNMTVALGGTVVVAPGTGTPILVNMSMAGNLIIGGTGNINSTSGSDVVYTSTGTLEYQNTTSRNVFAREWPTTSSPRNVIMNSSGLTMTLTSSRTIAGQLTLTNGALSVSGSGTALSFTAPATTQPIVRTSGTITATSSPSLTFAPVSGVGNWTLPAGTFTAAPTLTNMTVTMALGNSLTLNNQDITVTTYTQNSGNVILGTGSIQVATMSILSPGSTKMIITSATSGYVRRSFNTLSFQSFVYPTAKMWALRNTADSRSQ